MDYKNENFNWVFTADRNMSTLRKNRKLAAVLRETSENTWNNQSQNTLDPEMAQGYIYQVSGEIEGRVTKKLSKEFSRTESRVLGAQSKLDEFLLNPKVRTFSVAVPGTSRNSNSVNRESIGDRSLDDPCPKARFFSHHSGNLNSSEVEDYPLCVFFGVLVKFKIFVWTNFFNRKKLRPW